MIRKRKAEKELLLKKLTGSAPYDLERSGVLKSMTLSQLRIVDRMIKEVQKKSTYMMKCKNCQKLNAGMVTPGVERMDAVPPAWDAPPPSTPM